MQSSIIYFLFRRQFKDHNVYNDFTYHILNNTNSNALCILSAVGAGYSSFSNHVQEERTRPIHNGRAMMRALARLTLAAALRYRRVLVLV